MVAPRWVAIVLAPFGPTRTAITPVGCDPQIACTSTPRVSSSATSRCPPSSSPTLVISRAGSPTLAAQAQKLAACPPPPIVMLAGLSSSARSCPSVTIVMSRTRSPIESIIRAREYREPNWRITNAERDSPRRGPQNGRGRRAARGGAAEPRIRGGPPSRGDPSATQEARYRGSHRARPQPPGDRVLLGHHLRPVTQGRVAARVIGVWRCLRLRRWQGRLDGCRPADRGHERPAPPRG